MYYNLVTVFDIDIISLFENMKIFYVHRSNEVGNKLVINPA